MKIYDIKKNKNAIYCNQNYGPTFGSVTLAVNNCFLGNGGWCSSGVLSSFKDYDEDYEINKGVNEFKIEEIEVYEVNVSEINTVFIGI